MNKRRWVYDDGCCDTTRTLKFSKLSNLQPPTFLFVKPRLLTCIRAGRSLLPRSNLKCRQKCRCVDGGSKTARSPLRRQVAIIQSQCRRPNRPFHLQPNLQKPTLMLGTLLQQVTKGRRITLDARQDGDYRERRNYHTSSCRRALEARGYQTK
jgi:hypothetical protein